MLDFGLSKMVKEDLGQKTFTGFIGNLNYASPEMKKRYILKKRGPVHFYSNDQWGLKQMYQ